jgi:diadenosine tetraphosphate (Ap4A) HIT family hydrolase
VAELHPQLQKDCICIGRFELCRLLLMLDANYPWFILVPDHEGISEIYQLNHEDQAQLLHESSYLAEVIANAFEADKINIAALGNVVTQLHVHHIVRYRNDPAWPAPVWGKVPAKPYANGEQEQIIAKLKMLLGSEFDFYV